jgi:diguanylate cyclase (GGDEF)-like protein/putative nucleotidyltransferase with HDIG domain
MRHMFTLSPRRFGRALSAPAALALTALACWWVVTAAIEHHSDSARFARADLLQTAIDISRTERSLIAANTANYTTARAREIDIQSTEMMQLLRAADHAWGQEHRMRGLSDRYGTDILLADSPAHARKARAAFAAVASTATKALTAERVDALNDRPREGVLVDIEIGAAALAAIEGPLLLFWVVRRHRRRVERTHQRRVDQLAAQARTDTLTRLGNRRAFEDDLGSTIASRSETAQPFTLLAVDLDGLKKINDRSGHPAGDVQIRKVGDCLREVVGSDGGVYRTGGDEFMVILPGRRAWHGLNVAAKIDQVTRARTGARAVSIGLTESIETEGRHLLMNQADIALYEAKRTRLSAVAYHPGLHPAVDGNRDDLPSHEQRALAAALARAVDAKDAGTRSHSETVAQLCVAIGERLQIEPTDLERVRLAGLLHDVGKIGVADAILQKPDTLAPDELTAMTEHVEIGHAILLAAELPIEAHWVLHHHERMDGRGYPSGMSGASIPVESRIIAVADAFEAMTGTRPYREAVSVEEAIVELQANAGTQFDTRCVDALVDVVNDAATEEDLVGIAHGGHFKAIVPRPEPLPAFARS